ncbi:MAG: tRNA (N(6)-L-threonylcarbamoyladenosine(37)-C(2))-methylthiotransferase MtaB [Syntrophomonadaceae bacterium]|nr:tRNA (N(6)-L-threonylcarbamoyladenosine(37)-C(2))-methylthiotransferase MtaB [Syntrophomonadaceae bacterium]
MKTAAFYTLGCKVNQVETEQLKEQFLRKGYEIVPFNGPADVYVINTCTVTHVSDRKSRAMVRRIARQQKDSLVVVTGCWAETDPHQATSIEGVDLIVGNRDKEKIADLIDDVKKSESVTTYWRPVSEAAEKLPLWLYSQPHERTRAFIKIQDGCQSYCTYCIVPYARGPVRSKEPEDVLHEIKQLLQLGYKEIVLTGIHIGQYGKDMKGYNLEQLLDEILDKVPGDYRLRPGSIEINEITPPILALMSQDNRLCRHLHIPLQSGSDSILKAMGRKYDREDFRRLVNEVNEQIPGIAVTVDIMAGFPGEIEADFADSFNLLESLKLLDLHVFKYSRRPGTRAAEYLDQIDEKTKNYRSEQLLKLADKKRSEFLSTYPGQTLRLLVEKQTGPGQYTGLSDNYLEVSFTCENDLRGEFVQVQIESVQGRQLRGRLK